MDWRRPPRPVRLALLVFIGFLALAWLLVGLGDRLGRLERRRAAESLARAVADSLDAELDAATVAPVALATLVAELGRVPAEFDRAAKELLRLSPSADSLQLAPGGIIEHIFPLPGNEAALGLDLLRDPAQSPTVEEAMASRRVALAGPFELRQGGAALAARAAIFVGPGDRQAFWGLASAIVRLPALLASAGVNRLDDAGYAYRLTRAGLGPGGIAVVAGSSTLPQDPVSVTIPGPRHGWQLAVAPRAGWGPSSVVWMALVASALAALLVALLALRLFREPERLRHEVAARTAELESAHRAQRLAEASLRHSQKLEAVGLLAGGVAHDFNNMLVGIIGYAQLLAESARPGTIEEEAAQVIGQGARRAADLTQQLLAFARKGKVREEPVDLNALVEEVVRLLARTLRKDVEVVQRSRAARATVIGDPSQLHQVVLNLAVNARDAMPRGGTLTLETLNETLDDAHAWPLALAPGPYLVLVVRDTGVGMPPEVRERIFEPFFTTREDDQGTGMGLAMVYGIAKNHGGTVRVESQEGRGSAFEVWLPEAHQTSPRSAAPGPEPAVPTVDGGLVLVVDDEELVRRTALRMLRKLGLRTVEAGGGQEAVDWLQLHLGEASAVLLDFGMPDMDGLTCFRRLRSIEPTLPVLVSSGYAAEGQIQVMLAEGAVCAVPKPYTAAELGQAVFAAIASRRFGAGG